MLPERLARLPLRTLPGGLVVLQAVTLRSRLHGLAGCRALAPGHALLLAPCASVHTLGMRFALDLVWLDADGAVLALCAELAPRRVAGHRGARAVLEARAGEGAAFADALRDAAGRER